MLMLDMSAQSFEENIAALPMQPLSIRFRLSVLETSKKKRQASNAVVFYSYEPSTYP